MTNYNEKLDEILSEVNCWCYHENGCRIDDSQHEAKQAITSLITADRKRVALEARIETVMYIDSMLRFENIPLHPVQAESLKQYLRQLEAQQEEV